MSGVRNCNTPLREPLKHAFLHAFLHPTFFTFTITAIASWISAQVLTLSCYDGKLQRQSSLDLIESVYQNCATDGQFILTGVVGA